MALQLSSVDFSYSPKQQPVIQNLSLTVSGGDFVVLLGASGSGKSTIIRLCAGLLLPTSGRIDIFPDKVGGSGNATVVFQEYDRALLPWRSVLENARLPLEHLDLTYEAQLDAAFQALKLVGLEHVSSWLPQQLSGGMRQRLCIARALAMKPDVLLLDEPFGSLDARTREEVRTRVANIWSQRNIPTIMATHDIDEAILLGTHLALIKPSSGNVIELVKNAVDKSGSIEEVRASRDYIETWRQIRSFLYGGKR